MLSDVLHQIRQHERATWFVKKGDFPDESRATHEHLFNVIAPCLRRSISEKPVKIELRLFALHAGTDVGLRLWKVLLGGSDMQVMKIPGGNDMCDRTDTING